MSNPAILIVAENTSLRSSLVCLMGETLPATIYAADSVKVGLHYFSEPLGGPQPCLVILARSVGDIGREGFLRFLFDHPNASARLTPVFELDSFLGESGEPAMGLANLASLIGAVREALPLSSSAS
jgi:hypothetical protein